MKKLVVALSICVVAIAVQSAANAGDEQQKSRADDITTNFGSVVWLVHIEFSL